MSALPMIGGGGGKDITCLGTAFSTGSLVINCTTTNPKDLTDTYSVSDAFGGKTMQLSGGWGTVQGVGKNAQNQSCVVIMPAKSGKCLCVRYSTSSYQPEELNVTAGTQMTLLFAPTDSISFMMYE